MLKIPKLIKKVDRREYHNCDEKIRDEIVYAYLFKGTSHRALDITYRGYTRENSRGYVSMNILRYFGINKDFKGYFLNTELDEAISSLESLKDDSYKLIIDALRRYKENNLATRDGYKDLEDSLINQDGYEILESNEVYYEGSITTLRVNKYERNQEARRKCIEIHGCQCKVCGFDFEKVYGEVGKGLIHVHHVIPISSIKKEYQIDCEKDLIPVCPNCHAIIHRKKEPYTVEEVKAIIENKFR